MYAQNTWDMGSVIQVEKHYPGNYGAPGIKRAPKRKRTPEDIARQNERNKVKRVQRLIIANFGEGDWHLTLTHRKEMRPDTMEEARGYLKRFLDSMRAAYKRAGYPFKYIYVTERGKKGACHHHLIIEDIATRELNTKEMVLKFWPHGMRNFSPLYEEGEFEDLAEYIVKRDTKEGNRGCSYSHSRNLVIPKPKKETVHRKTWRRDPKPKRGYYIVKSSVVNGMNPVTGYPYQHYTMRRYAQREETHEDIYTGRVRGGPQGRIQLREPRGVGSGGPRDNHDRDHGER